MGSGNAFPAGDQRPEPPAISPMPERLDAYMARANAAYYRSHDPFADFTTAPEIGQVFGELLGAWAAVVWESMGSPDPVLLVEAGPGRGTLMRDALRAAARVAPAFRAACRVRFIENSARLRAIQAAAVPDAEWHTALEDLPAGPAIVLANEFLDALPIRQYERRGDGWFERYVEAGGFVLQPMQLPAEAAPDAGFDVPKRSQGDAPGDMVPEGAVAGGEIPEGAVIEHHEAGVAWVGAMAGRLVRQGGAALILDYGRAAPGFGDSLQALRGAQPADPLREPGEADLTAHVDFPAIMAAARRAGALGYGPVPQGGFLNALGLRLRTERLAAANPDRAALLRDAADRLVSPARMGQLFKVVAITAPGVAVPPGFA
jgi:NADH dehydrogenase [ubiquinone] 1 alpha subcomplex assembly factor 7